MEEELSKTQPADATGSTPSGDCFGLVGQRLDNKYDVEAVVAEGGFGVVYRATHRTLHKPVAIKVLKVPADMSGATRAEFLAKFALEARTVASLEHPAIVRVLDFGACPMPKGEAAPWMSLEWLTGTTLEADLAARKGSPRSPSEVLALMQPVLDGMAMAHAEGIVHRDIKPANLMLVKDRSGDLRLRILDFGIAKLMGSEERLSSGQTATQSTLHAFSLHAAAPEQISGTRTGPWTDVHALALLITEMLTGMEPYAGADATEVYAAVLGAQRPTPAKFGFDVGVWESVLARALSLRPADRYPDARALSEALAAHVPATVARGESGASVATPRTSGDSSVVTTLRPASKPTDLAATVRPRGRWVMAAVVLTGGLIGGIAYRFAAATNGVAPVVWNRAPVAVVRREVVAAPASPAPPVVTVSSASTDAGGPTALPPPSTREDPPTRGSSVVRPSARVRARPLPAPRVESPLPIPAPTGGPQRPSEVPVE